MGKETGLLHSKVRTRPVGATAVLSRNGHPQVTSETQGELEIVTAASSPGFNPLDLLYASLAGCLVLSARISASHLGLLEKFTEASAYVTGEKTVEEAAFRINRSS